MESATRIPRAHTAHLDGPSAPRPDSPAALKCRRGRGRGRLTARVPLASNIDGLAYAGYRRPTTATLRKLGIRASVVGAAGIEPATPAV